MQCEDVQLQLWCRLRAGRNAEDECTAEPTLLCTLLDFADDAEADTRQATDLSDAGAKVFQLFDDAVTLLFLA